MCVCVRENDEEDEARISGGENGKKRMSVTTHTYLLQAILVLLCSGMVRDGENKCFSSPCVSPKLQKSETVCIKIKIFTSKN